MLLFVNIHIYTNVFIPINNGMNMPNKVKPFLTKIIYLVVKNKLQ